MVTKRQLLVYTRYYKGEAECPPNVKRLENGESLWEMERSWVTDTINNTLPPHILTEYATYAFKKVPSGTGLPVPMLAYLFHRLSKWSFSLSSCAETFPDFIKKYYG